MSFIMWSSNWVRTLFFNSTQFDEQNSKFSSKIRAFELAQNSSSNKVWSFKSIRRTELFVQFNSSNKILDSILELIAQFEIFVWVEIRIKCSTNKYVCSIQFVERNAVFNSIRRTKIRIRSILSNKTNEFDSIRRTKNLCLILLNLKIERSSLNSTQFDDHSSHSDTIHMKNWFFVVRKFDFFSESLIRSSYSLVQWKTMMSFLIKYSNEKRYSIFAFDESSSVNCWCSFSILTIF
jgi:hypothetical protein